MSLRDWEAELQRMLAGMGHSPSEIERILEKVRQYDDATAHHSLMDAIGAGEVNLNELIAEALNQG